MSKETAFLSISKTEDGNWNNSIQDFTLNDVVSLSRNLGDFFHQLMDKALDENNLAHYKEAEYLLASHDFLVGIGMKPFADVLEKAYILDSKYNDPLKESAKRLNRSMDQRIKKLQKEQEEKNE